MVKVIAVIMVAVSLVYSVFAQDDHPLLIQTHVEGKVNTLAWNAEGTALAAASANGLTILTNTLETLAQLHSSVSIDSVSWSPCGQQLAVTNESSIEIWDWDAEARDLSLARALPAPTRQIFVIWKPTGERIASLGMEMPLVMGGGTLALITIYIWNTDTWQLERIVPHQYIIDSYELPANLLEWNPDGSSQLIGVGNEGYMETGDVLEGTNLRSREVVGITGLIAWVIDADTGVQVKTISLLGPPFDYSVARQPDGELIAVGNKAGVVLYDYSSGEFVDTINASIFVRNVAWSPDGRYIAGGSGVGEAETGDVLGYYDMDRVTYIAWSPNGRSLALGNSEGEIAFGDLSLLLSFGLFSKDE